MVDETGEVDDQEEQPEFTSGQIREEWVTKFGTVLNKMQLRDRGNWFDSVLAEEPVAPIDDIQDWADLSRQFDELKAELADERQGSANEAERSQNRINEKSAHIRQQLEEIRRLNDLVGRQQDQIANLEERVADSPRVRALKIAREVLAASSVAGTFSAKTIIAGDDLITVADWILTEGGPDTWTGILRKTFGEAPDEGDDGSRLLSVDELGYGQSADPEEDGVTFYLDEKITVRSAIDQTIGAASSCWSNLAGAGEFDSDRALQVASTLEDWLRPYLVR